MEKKGSETSPLDEGNFIPGQITRLMTIVDAGEGDPRPGSFEIVKDVTPKETEGESVPVAQEKSVIKKVAPVVNKMAKGIEKPGNVSFVEAENTTVD